LRNILVGHCKVYWFIVNFGVFNAIYAKFRQNIY
jgi:hypothetical protein